MKIKHFFIAFFLLLTSFNSFAQKIILNEIGFILKPEEKSEIYRLLDYETRIFNGLFNNSKNDSLIITINLFCKGKDFREQLEIGKMKGLTESGFFNPLVNESYVLYNGKEDIKTVVHEASHALTRNSIKFCPKWFNEGLAEFLESMEVTGLTIQIVSQTQRIQMLKSQYIPINGLNLTDFFADSNSWRNKNKLDYMYTVAYSVIYFLIKKDPSLISQIAQMFEKGYSTSYIFDKKFGGITNFQNAYKFFYRYN